MRIVIDGAHGSGKTTFLKGVIGEKEVPNIAARGDTIFSDYIGKSFFEGKRMGLVPPQDLKDWEILFSLIMNKGLQQYNDADIKSVNWYDRGLHFINVISEMENISLQNNILSELPKYMYDYVFIFEPIESCDFTKIRKAGWKAYTMDERYDCSQKTYNAYEKSGHRVYKVPLFSDNYTENFNKRYDFINHIISNG